MDRAGARVGAVAALLAALAAPARAEPPTYRLDYRAHAGCPTGDVVAAAVVERLGRDPFVADAPVTLRVVIARLEGGFGAAIQWYEAGQVTGTREIESDDAGDCRALAAAVALAIVIAIDPMADTAEPIELAVEPVAGEIPAPPAAAPPPARAIESPVARHRAPLRWVVGSGPVATVGAAPRWTPAVAALIEATRGRLGLGLQLQAHWPRAEPVGPGEVRGWLATAAAVPCAGWRSLAGCGLISAGFVRGRGAGGLDQTRAATTFHAAVGARIQWTIGWRGRLGARLYADGQLALVRTALTVNEIDVWELPAASAGLGLLALARW